MSEPADNDQHIQKAVNQTLQSMINNLRDDVIPNSLRDANILKYNVKWNDGVTEHYHRDYISLFCDEFYVNCKALIQSSILAKSRLFSNDLYVEVLQHSAACIDYVKRFQGRQDILDKIKCYIEGSSRGNTLCHTVSY